MMSQNLKECFSKLEDPRVERHKRHKLLDIIMLTICAVINGAEGWEAIKEFGEAPENFNIICQLSIGLLKKESSKMSIKAKRFKAALTDSFREHIIFAI